MNEFDPIIGALEESARKLDADPCSIPTPEFRGRCRSRLTEAASRGGWRRHLPVPRRFLAAGLAACLSALLVVPAMAGPGGVSGTVESVRHGVSHMLGSPANPDALTADPDSTTGPGLRTTTHPANHGADVSTVAKDTPEPGENHGQQVREVARDNHGHTKSTEETSASDNSTATSTATATETSAAATTETETEQHGQGSANHGDDVSAAAQDKPDTNHGSEVSDVAHSTPTGDENHGQQVRSVAEDNHGHDVSATAHSTPTPPSNAPSTAPTETPDSSSSHGSSNSTHDDDHGHGGD